MVGCVHYLTEHGVAGCTDGLTNLLELSSKDHD